MVDPANKKRTGRPRWVPPLKEIEALASRGLNDEQISDALGIDRKTLQRHKKASEDVRKALQHGKALGIAEVSNALFDAAKAGNVTAQIFFLKCRAGWNDQPKPEQGNAETMASRICSAIGQMMNTIPSSPAPK